MLVTGSSSGIGRAIAVECSKNGARVLVHYRKNQAGAGETLAEVAKYTAGKIFQADLSQLAEVKKLYRSFGSDFPDYLVNNAGESVPGDAEDYDLWESQWRNIFMSQVYMINEFVKNKSTEVRKIVNISSIYGLFNMGDVDFVHYSAAKAAVNSLTAVMARKLAPKILINAVAPGWVWTPPWEGTSKADQLSLTSLTKINRFIQPEEIASMVLALLKNNAMTGEIIRVDGGLHLPRITS